MRISFAVISCSFAVFGLTITPVQAETQRDRCQNIAKVAYQFAAERDKGVSSQEIGKRITSIYKSGGLDEAEYMTMYALAGMVYSDLKAQSPEQIRRSFIKQCA